MRSTRFACYFIVLVFITIAALLYSGVLFRVHESRRWSIRFCDGDKADIDGKYSNSDEFAVGPSFVWGGGSPKYDLDIKFSGKTMKWKGALEPIILEKDGDAIWLVTWNSSNLIVKDEFVILAYREGGWHRADRSEFPPHLAVVNLDWREADATSRVRERIEQEGREYLRSVDFRGSENARFWLYMNGKETATIHYTIDEPFVLDYYEREIKGHCGSVSLGVAKRDSEKITP